MTTTGDRPGRSAAAEVILVRHGESAGNAAGLLVGRMDAPLTERGAAQAQAIGPLVERASRLVSSPLRRARDTAAALGTGLPVEVDERWIEVDYGEYDGRPLSEVAPETWAAWRADPDFSPPGGESLRAAGLRVRAACQELLGWGDADGGTDADGDAGPVVVVSHVTPIKVATCWALGLGDEATWRLYLATASVTRIRRSPAGPVLRQFNGTPWAGRGTTGGDGGRSAPSAHDSSRPMA